MLENIIETKVYYFDTDIYGIVWHGAYVKWFEMGRVEFIQQTGLDLLALMQQDIYFPVVNLDLRYKKPASYGDTLITKTTIDKLSQVSIKFLHKVINKETNNICAIGSSEVVTTQKNNKIYRRLPNEIYNALAKCVT